MTDVTTGTATAMTVGTMTGATTIVTATGMTVSEATVVVGTVLAPPPHRVVTTGTAVRVLLLRAGTMRTAGPQGTMIDGAGFPTVVTLIIMTVEARDLGKKTGAPRAMKTGRSGLRIGLLAQQTVMPAGLAEVSQGCVAAARQTVGGQRSLELA